MAVEIKELIIRAVLADDVSYEPGERNADTQTSEQPGDQKLIQACVKQVLKILRNKKHR